VLHVLAKDHIKHEDEGKFRCRTCNKLFKALNFVEKHISNKHPDLLDKNELHRVRWTEKSDFRFTQAVSYICVWTPQVNYYNNFATDPAHVMPPVNGPPDPPPMSGPLGPNGMGGPGAMPFAMFGGYGPFMYNPYLMPGFPFTGMMGNGSGGPPGGTMDGGDYRGERGGGGGGGGRPGGGKQLGDRIGDRIEDDRGAKRQRRGGDRPNVHPPEGRSLDPRATRNQQASYADLDAAQVPTGGDDLLDLY
jgi:hypothetical protein